MGKYSIVNTSSVKFGKYQDVLRIIAREEKKTGFFARLFSSPPVDIYFILSKDSPLAKQVQCNNIWDVDESMFRTSTMHGITYLIELEFDKFESAKAKRIENERRERELKAQKDRELKAQREHEAREAAESERKENDVNRIHDLFEKATIHKMPFSGLRLDVDKNDSFSNQMKALAGNANMAFLQRDTSGFQNSIINLYNKVHGYNSHKLKTIAANDGQCIGLAFIKMALYFDNGDFQVNEIAAQNAFYCIVKDFKNSGNTYALPALFTLLLKKPRSLEDELYRANADPDLAGWGGMTLSAPYARHDRAMSNRLPLMKFLLQKFYDERQRKFIIDMTLPYHIPSEADVAGFLNEYGKSQYASKADSVSIGEKFLNKVYDDIVDQLDL